jgi:hypothetical protein
LKQQIYRWVLILIAAQTGAGCGLVVAPDPGDISPAASVLLIGIIGLDTQDSLLGGLPPATRIAHDVLATGRGSAAALALLDGRDAIDQLRAPGDPLAWAAASGLPVRVDVLDRSLISEPEWVASGIRATVRDSLPATGQRGLHVIFLPRHALQPKRIAGLITEALDRGCGLVILTGIPTAPSRTQRRRVGGGLEEARTQHQVPLLVWGKRANQVAVDGRLQPGNTLGFMRNEFRGKSRLRIARWWNSLGGGLLVDNGRWVAFAGDNQSPVLIDIQNPDENLASLNPGLADSLIALAAPHGDLMILIRGSRDADLATVELLLDTSPAYSPWGLEPIDAIDHPTLRYLVLSLAAEAQGDGIVLEDWSGHTVDVRINPRLEDAPLIGTPIRDAVSGQWLGVDALRLGAWSRDFWRLRGSTDFDPDSWWTSTMAGVDLLWVNADAELPVPVQFDR